MQTRQQRKGEGGRERKNAPGASRAGSALRRRAADCFESRELYDFLSRGGLFSRLSVCAYDLFCFKDYKEARLLIVYVKFLV